MPYLFALLVIANAGYLGYQLLQEKEPTLLQPITIATHKDFPTTLTLVPEHALFQRTVATPAASSAVSTSS
jgi:hypothetical protein